LPITAIDAISPAIEHTKQQLFMPFRLGQWTKLAFVGLLAGELGSGGFNRSNFNFPRHPGTEPAPHITFPGSLGGSLGVDPVLLISFIAAAVIAALAIGIILMFVSSVMRFILFDSIILKECLIRAGWGRRLKPGWRYFVWKIGYLALILAGICILLGFPAAFVFASGWYKEPKEHLAPLILAGATISLILLTFFLITAVVFVLTKDFVIPQMALEGISATEGWRRLWPMMKAEKGAYVAYIAMKIVLAIVAGAMIAVVAVIVSLIYVIPAAALGAIAILEGKAAGLTWNPHTIALAVIVGLILLAGFLYLVSLVSVPAIVFFPAFSIYFFADRYPRLAAALNPALPAMAGAAPPQP
jgi:hypothetical protein